MAAIPLDNEAIRRRAYELSQLNPDATAEENWLLAEAEFLAAADLIRHEARIESAEDTADLMAKIEMAVYGHA
jgi:hypothetical protein